MVLSAEIVKVPDRVQQTRFAAQFSLAQALYPQSEKMNLEISQENRFSRKGRRL
jgi:hypothetical protein